MATRVAFGESIKRELRQRILAGDLLPGARVPSEFELVEQYGASRSQTRQALRDLEIEGILVRRRGSGTYVSPNLTPEHLAGTRLDTVTICFPEYQSLYVRQVIEGFMERMFAAGMKVTTYHAQMDADGESAFLNTADRMSTAGLVMWLLHDTENIRRALMRLSQTRFPVVLVDRCPKRLDVDHVTSDNRAMGYELTRRLLDAGHRRIGFVTSARDTASTLAERHAGYVQALAEAGLDADPRFLIRLDEGQESFRAEVTDAMAYRDRPTAFVSVNADLVRWVEDELIRLGWSGSDEMVLAFVDDRYPGDEGRLPCVTVRQDGSAMGTKCAELLLERIKDPGKAPRGYVVAHRSIAVSGPKPN